MIKTKLDGGEARDAVCFDDTSGRVSHHALKAESKITCHEANMAGVLEGKTFCFHLLLCGLSLYYHKKDLFFRIEK